MKNKLKKSVFLLSSLMMLTVGAGVVGGISESPVGVAEAAEVTAEVSFADKANRTVFILMIKVNQQVMLQIMQIQRDFTKIQNLLLKHQEILQVLHLQLTLVHMQLI